MIPYGRHTISPDDITSVVDALNSTHLTQGSLVGAFEEKLSRKLHASYSLVYNSATSALKSAYYALGVEKGDRVWTSPNTFVATANAAILCGAQIDFVDIDSRTFNIDPNELERKLKIAKKQRKLPKVVVPVHFAGQSSDMIEIKKLSEIYGFRIIEDASHAIGGSYNGTPIGAGIHSDITVFSFHPVKIITTGEGGALLTNDADIARLAHQYREHGVSRQSPGPKYINAEEIWNYHQIGIGENYRLTEIQAALGLSQLKRLDQFVRTRNEIAMKYDQEIDSSRFITPYVKGNVYSSYHLYVIRLKQKLNNDITRNKLYHYLHQNQIYANIHYIPVYLQPYYRRMGFERGYCPESEKHFREALTIPIYPTMRDTEILEVVRALNTFQED